MENTKTQASDQSHHYRDINKIESRDQDTATLLFCLLISGEIYSWRQIGNQMI